MGSNQSIYEKKIKLKNKGLRNIDSDIKRYDMIKSFKSPRTLNMAYNKLTILNQVICFEFANFKNVHEHLREVNLSHNKIQVIPEEFLQLVNVSHLKLDHNEIEEIPNNFARCLYNLQALFLNHNKLNQIPWNFNKLRQLRTIALNNNNLTYIPNSFGELQLEELSLQANRLNEELFASSTVEGTLEAILNQKIPKEYREQVRELLESWESEGKGKSELERQFLFFLQQVEFRKHFFAYMEKEYSHENLDFWERVDRFKLRYDSILEVRAPEMLREAIEIYSLFIAEKAPHSINIPAQASSTLRKIFSDTFLFPQGINQWVFDASYESVFQLMFSDTFTRYRITEEGRTNFTAAVKLWDTRIRRLSGK